MSRVLVVLIAALVVAGAAVWFATHTESRRGARPALEERPVAEVEQGAPALASGPPSPEARSEAEQPPSAVQPAAPGATHRESASLEDAELARAQWVDGRVVFPPGTPEDEEAFVVADGRNFEDGGDHRAKVARDGSFRVAFSEKTRTGHFELAARYLYLAELAGWKSKESSEVVLEPTLGARVAGHVSLPAGADAASAGGTVELEVVRGGAEYNSETVRSHELSKGLDFAFDALPPGSEITYVLAYDGPTLLGNGPRLVPEPGKTYAITLELRPGLTIAGVVRDESGAPLDAVELEASIPSHSLSEARANWRTTTSAADGSFRLGALVGGEVTLKARLDGYEPLERSLGRFAEGESVKDVVLVLSRGSSIAGVVRWPDGSPAEVTLTLTPHLTNPGRNFDSDDVVHGASDASGAFSISGLSYESYRVTASATKTEEVQVESALTGRERTKKQRSQWSAKIDPVRAGTKDVVLALSTGLVVEGRVTDDLGAPIEDFNILATRAGEDGPGSLSRPFRGSDGTFRMDGFAPGEWKLRGRSAGAESTEVRVTVPGGGPVALVVPRESIVKGRVLDPRGSPVAGAAVREGMGLGLPRDDRTHSNEQGFFEIDRLGPGPIVLQAIGSSFAPSEPLTLELVPGEERTCIVLRLRPGGTILGELVGADGSPQPGRTVWISDHLGFSAILETDEQGQFRVSGLPPGEVVLFAETLESFGLHESVQLGEGETVHVRLAPPGETVRLYGTVRAGGEPVANASLWASQMGADGRRFGGGASSSSKTGEDGSYEIQLPGSGSYWLKVQGDDETTPLSWSAALEVPAAEAFRFEVAIPVGRISGRVTDERGQALPEVLVESEPEQHEGGSHGSASALTDADGSYELVVPAGQHAVVAGGARNWPARDLPYAEARVGGLVVAENAHLRGVDLRLESGGILEGSVKFLDGSPGIGAFVWAEAGGRKHEERAAEGSRFQMRLAAGSYLVGASLMGRDDTGCTPVEVEVEVASGETREVELSLVTARLVTVTVRQKGVLVGSEMQAFDEKGRRQLVQTLENGHAVLGPLVPGRYTVRAKRDGLKVEKTFDVRPEEKEPKVEIVFE